jgi:hypothetical protein
VKLSVRGSGKVLAAQDVTIKSDGQIQSETLVFNVGEARAEDSRKSAWSRSRATTIPRTIRLDRQV